MQGAHALRRFGLALVCAAALTGCSGVPRASDLAKPPEFAPKGETKCQVAKSASSPLIVEWPSTERARLESMAKSGPVVVRYEGCEMQTLASCKAKGRYRYQALTPKRDSMRIRNEDDLYASMPVHAASFEGKLHESGELGVRMTIVGRYEAEDARASSAAELEGDCAKATHVIAAITVGTFRFSSGADAEVSGGVSVLGAGGGGRSAASRETLAEDGDEKACASAGSDDTKPPFGCGALLRVEVTPIDRRAAPRLVPMPASATATTPTPTPTPTATASSGRYAISGTTVLDSKTKLTWQRAPDKSSASWADAKALCAGLSDGGAKWRLPTRDELLGLGENLPAGIDRNAFPASADREDNGVMSSTVFYWSATPHERSDTMAFAVRYGVMGAQAVLQQRSSRHLVRCVR